MLNRPYDILRAVPYYKQDGNMHGIKRVSTHVTVTGKIQTEPEFSIVEVPDKKTGYKQRVKLLRMKIRSHKVSKSLAYYTKDSESETWTDNYQNTYFQLDVWDTHTMDFVSSNFKYFKKNTPIGAIGFVNKQPKMYKGIVYPNFHIHTTDILI